MEAALKLSNFFEETRSVSKVTKIAKL